VRRTGAGADGRVRLAVLSLAHHHAEAYLAILSAMPGVELVGLWDEDAERGRRVAAANGTRAFPTGGELLGAGIHGAIVCSVNTHHRGLVESAAAAGVHVLCEKPLATSIEDARAMVDACADAGSTLMTAFPMRFSPPVQALHAAHRAGSIGDVVCIEGVNTGEIPDVHRAWFVDRALSGGGAVADHVVHLADLYRWLLRSEVVQVYAVANAILRDRFSAVETGGLVSLRFANGVFATIDCSWSKPGSYPTWGGLSVEVVGTRGAVTVDAFGQHLVLHGEADAGTSWPFWGSDPSQAMLAEFASAIREGRQPAVTGVDGLRAVEIVDAAYRSIAEGQPVTLEQNV
jgi:predicted dehydrogenase